MEIKAGKGWGKFFHWDEEGKGKEEEIWGRSKKCSCKVMANIGLFMWEEISTISSLSYKSIREVWGDKFRRRSKGEVEKDKSSNGR